MRNDPFHVPKARLGRAKQGLRSLAAKGEAFFKKQPHTTVIETNPDTGEQVHKLKLTKTIPSNWNILASETVEHLRAVLDQAGFVTAHLSGNTNAKSAYFPIADSLLELDTSVIGRKRCKDLPPDILTLFRTFAPYKGGNNALWALNRLCSTSKHKLLSVGLTCQRFTSKSPGFIYNGIIPAPSWDREKNEMIFAIIGPKGSFKYDFEFAFHVSFGEVPELGGDPAFPMLAYIITEVETVLTATEAEARRVGLLK